MYFLCSEMLPLLKVVKECANNNSFTEFGPDMLKIVIYFLEKDLEILTIYHGLQKNP